MANGNEFTTAIVFFLIVDSTDWSHLYVLLHTDRKVHRFSKQSCKVHTKQDGLSKVFSLEE